MFRIDICSWIVTICAKTPIIIRYYSAWQLIQHKTIIKLGL